MKVIKTYEEWESLVKTKKKDICIMLCNGAKEHFASFEKAFTVGVVMTEDGDLSIGGDEEECVAYARFSLANYGYPDVYIDEYEFELFARECDEYEDAKRCAEESGMSLISYVLKSSRDSELYKIFKKIIL